MKKVLGIIILAGTSLTFLPSCMPAPQTAYAENPDKDMQILKDFRTNWYNTQQIKFYIKQIAVEVKELKKAIAEINKQLEKQKTINTDFASKLFTLQQEVKKLNIELNNVKTFKTTSEQKLKTLDKKLEKLFKEIKELKKEIKTKFQKKEEK